MTIKRYLSLIILFLVSIIHQSPAQQNKETDSEVYQKFETKELISDFDRLFETLESIHPDLYFYTPKDSIDALREEAKSKMDHPMTALEFWKIIAPIVVQLKDGHTGLHFPPDARKVYYDSTRRNFPVDVHLENNKLLVSKNYTEDTQIGINSEILSINGIAADSILSKVRLYQAGERDVFIDLKTGYLFRPYLWALYSLCGDFKITYISDLDGKQYSKSYTGITHEEYNSAKQSRQKNQKPFTFYAIPEANTGVIDFRHMVKRNEFKAFLDSCFTVIMNDSLMDLIIDIRKNGGGNSMLADDLLSHFNTKPYTQATQMDIKVSKQARKQFRKMFFKWYMYPIYPAVFFNKYTKSVFRGKKGKVVPYFSEPEAPKTSELFFTGDVYLLTGPNTFSSANILSAVFKCYDMGTMIGEETGGLTIAFGDIIRFELPNTKISGGCSYKKFYHPCGKPDNHGVIPDIIVKQDPEDSKKGKDTVMDYTIELIMQEK